MDLSEPLEIHVDDDGPGDQEARWYQKSNDALAEFLEKARIPTKIKRIIELMLHEPAKLDWNQPIVVKLEKALIFKYGCNRAFRERGPPGPESGGPQLWRNQEWRKGSNRWGQ